MSAASQQNVPRRALVVDDDEAVRVAVTALLKAADFEVVASGDGEEALTMLGRQTFPLVITDCAIPVLDGIQFVCRLRAVAITPIYVIMLSGASDADDYERGYCAGVDHFMSKKGFEAELTAKANAGIASMRRRRQSAVARTDGPVTIDIESGAHTARHLVGRLHAEIAHASRVKQPLNVLSVCIESDASAEEAIPARASEGLLQAVHLSVRPKLDWIARLPAARTMFRLAIVMPQSVESDVASVEQGIRNALVHANEGTSLRNVQMTFGVAALGSREKPPTALELLGESERARRGAGAKKEAEPLKEAEAARKTHAPAEAEPPNEEDSAGTLGEADPAAT